MCCHLAGPPKRLALDPQLHQGLRRKNQPGLVCSSTDYKSLGDFFYLPLWYGPQSWVSVLSTAAWQSFLLTPPLCHTSAFFCFSFSSCGCLPCGIFTSNTLYLYSHIGNFSEYTSSYDGVNPYSILFILPGSEITKENSTILYFEGFI